ncbi:hypothetical protein DFJ63DRAFT_317259 [Scheffersomyces coipomensis]|uniref:uncharacterized protein n=1 Tax=Scheffersomyces coipomensis TaxID=1788519 RepID=UPI00315C61AE
MKFALFKYLIVFYTFLTVAFAMGEGYEEISACLDDSLSDYNVYFNDQRPVTVEPREIRDFDADLDSIVTECISYLNLTAIVGTRGNIQYINSLHSYDEDDDVYTFDYLNDAHFLSFNCQSY